MIFFPASQCTDLHDPMLIYMPLLTDQIYTCAIEDNLFTYDFAFLRPALSTPVILSIVCVIALGYHLRDLRSEPNFVIHATNVLLIIVLFSI